MDVNQRRFFWAELSQDELKERATALASAIVEHVKLQQEKKDLVDSYNARLKTLMESIKRLAETVHLEKEYREVDISNLPE